MIGLVNGEEPLVVQNDRFTWEELRAFHFDNIVISPGPGRPDNPADFGVCADAILHAHEPVLGICLGFQGIGRAYGAQVVHAPEPMHGRRCTMLHDGSPLYAGIASPFHAVRYHSLTVAPELPAFLQATVWTSDGVLMGLEHRHLPRFGVQFHPESILSEYGDVLLKNFRDLTPRRAQVGYTALPAESSRKPVEQLPHRVHSRKVTFDPAQTAAVFEMLYAREPYSFWLDGDGMSRFSFMGASNGKPGSFATPGNPYEYLAEELARRRCMSEDLPFEFNCGFVGYLPYDGDAAFLFADRLIAVDHAEHAAWMVSYGTAEAAQAWFASTEPTLSNPVAAPARSYQRGSTTLRLARDREAYVKAVRQCQRYIRDGESYEICLTNRITADSTDDPFALYLRLRQLNPAPYSAYLRFGETAVLSASPERFLKIDSHGAVESKPIKGTRRRGNTAEEDRTLACELGQSEKDRSENLMIVDLLRNDLGRVCEVGSVHVPKLMEVETYETVHQLVSTVRGQLNSGADATACIRAAFPGGSMTGAPKIRTMKLIRELEARPRGIYSGALGFLALNGAADLSIVIRTLIATASETTLGIGGAVVALSNPEEEFEEILVKARGSLQALLPDEAAVERALSNLREHGSAYCEAFKA